jgi:hypothetical protein
MMQRTGSMASTHGGGAVCAGSSKASGAVAAATGAARMVRGRPAPFARLGHRSIHASNVYVQATAAGARPERVCVSWGTTSSSTTTTSRRRRVACNAAPKQAGTASESLYLKPASKASPSSLTHHLYSGASFSLHTRPNLIPPPQKKGDKEAHKIFDEVVITVRSGDGGHGEIVEAGKGKMVKNLKYRAGGNQSKRIWLDASESADGWAGDVMSEGGRALLSL